LKKFKPQPIHLSQAVACSNNRGRLSPFGVFRTDEHGYCTYTNAAWQDIYGLTLAESLGDGWTRGLHPDDREFVARQWLADAENGRPFDLVFRVLRKDGIGRHVRARAWSVPGGTIGTVEDVTEAEARSQQLRSTAQLLDRTGQIAGVGAWDIDLRTREVRWSTQTYRIYERTPDWRPSIEDGMTYYAPEARPVIAALVERAIQEGQPFDAELPFITATGRHLRVRAVGDVERDGDEPIRLFGAFQDVTAQRNATDELHASRERLRQLYDDTPALMASVGPQGQVLSISRLMLARLGLVREAVVGAPAAVLLHGQPAERRETLSRVRQRLRAQGGIEGMPVSLAHRDGAVVHTLMSGVVERDAEGRSVRLLAVFEDISETVQSQAELTRERALREMVERQASELSRLADERREMLDVLAHEVRQPLNNALAALQSAAALGGSQRGDDAMLRLARAHGVIGDIVAQIDNTLAAAALLVGTHALQRTDTDIDMLLQLVVADFAPADRSRFVIERQTPTRTASMDLSLMRLALRNLMANALRHAPAGSPVTLRVADSDEPLALLLEVEDLGPGVADAVRAKLFERGVRGPASRGQGLGLHIAQRALQLHAGTAELVRSGPGLTVFRLVLVQGDPDVALAPSPPGAP
jgi:PAS domain S-box-containing protein